jgi:leucyl-tRNA synthetase
MWHTFLKHKNLVSLQKWPKYNEKMISDNTTTIIVQVNGKVRATFKAKKGENQKVLEDKAKELVKKYLVGKKVKKTIFVADRLVNFVI